MNKERIIDRVIRMYVSDIRTGQVQFILEHLKGVKMSSSTNNVDVLDAKDTIIDTLYRAKMFELSGSNALLNLDMLAEQRASRVNVSDALNTFVAPCAEEIQYAVGADAVALAHTPISGPNGEPTILYIYTLEDGVIDQTFEYAAEASATEFTYSGTDITLPLGLADEVGGTLLVVYEYEANDEDVVVKIEDGVNKTNGLRKVLLECVFRDKCNQKSKYFGWIELPRCRFSGDYDLDMQPDGAHPFTIRAVRAFCNPKTPLCVVYMEDMREDADFERDYNEYFGKPSINGVILRGDKSFEDLHIGVAYPLSPSEIDAALGW